ncbi:T9SS type A sorting domain-containing protein [Rasiella rasia]|uniref:T9SS type A sorting domain-containing protein n=1 Tax=Rasiella rasia TaxID=2744027 RepID=A0A6G6GJ97_9FLAO|nr:T9SS type A sorting domain-containing protein [Rasiella rasia]QIE58493.1 T9SS type A sorting domain-containing protein [Rasiella rasia]
MKTTTFFTLLVCMVFSQLTVAQSTDLSVLLDRLEGNHIGSIYDVFTVEEVAQLRKHFDAQNNAETVRYVGDMPIRATENTKGNSVVINPTNLATVEVIAPSPLNDFEGAGATIPGTARAIIVDNNNIFYEVDSNGMYVTIGGIPAGAGQSFTGLEYSSDGILYGIATDGMGSTALYEIDILGGQATAVGGDNGLVVGIALGRDMMNNLYALDIDTDLVHRIDRTTGAATALGPIGFDSEFGQGMSYNPADNSLVATTFNSGTFKPELRTINTATGASTLLGTIVPSQTLQFAWMSIFDATLGTTEESLANLTLYPNPAEKTLTIASEVNISAIKIYNTLGQELLTQEVAATTAKVDISSLATGTYIVQISAKDAQTTLKFVKE